MVADFLSSDAAHYRSIGSEKKIERCAGSFFIRVFKTHFKKETHGILRLFFGWEKKYYLNQQEKKLHHKEDEHSSIDTQTQIKNQDMQLPII